MSYSSFNLLGMRVEKKTDLLAATAFMLSMITAVYQFYGLARGPNLSIHAPDRISLFYDPLIGNLRVASPITFLNEGQAGRNVVVRDVDAIIYLDGVEITRQRWLNSVRIENRNVVAIANAVPVQVSGGSSFSQTFSFAPRSSYCGGSRPCEQHWIYDDVFPDKFEDAKRLSIAYESRMLGEKSPYTAACDVMLNNIYRDDLVDLRFVDLPCGKLEESGRIITAWKIIAVIAFLTSLFTLLIVAAVARVKRASS